MAKAKIEYDLNDSDDVYAHKRAIKSLDLTLAIWTITHNTKKSLEWSMEGKEMDKYDALEMVFDKIHEIINEHNIVLDDLIE
jgi:hypothetical protein